MKMLFESQHFEEHHLGVDDLIRLHVYALSLNQDPVRPMLLLKDESGKHVLPVGLNPLEAGMTIQQSSQHSVGVPASPHKVTELLLESLGMKVEKCVFVELKGVHQFVRLYFEGHPTHGSLKVQADQAMSLCLHLNVPIFATKKMMEKSRTMTVEVDLLAQNAKESPLLNLRTHQYLI